MLKKNIILCMALTALLSGCMGVNQNAAKNNKHTSVSSNKGINKTLDNKRLTEPKKVTSTPKTFTPLVISNTSSLSTKAIFWSWLYSARDSAALLSKYKGYGFGDTSKKLFILLLMKDMKMDILPAF
ncbi:hypothetical protein [Clostridium sp. DMHC 10]|uniref:hypothetical protein n=1 Tax=Clostridium sp. DMHC 10 TaxID=747377 RepID=UPI000ABE69D6|nr:hypothetical protein [Clostridium sp. DMHC 10]